LEARQLKTETKYVNQADGFTTPVNGSILDDVRLLKNESPVRAIRLLRSLYGISLVDAKAIIEAKEVWHDGCGRIAYTVEVKLEPVTITLSVEEAKILRVIAGSIGGEPNGDNPRVLVDRLYNLLCDAGYDRYANEYNIEFKNHTLNKIDKNLPIT
jgi:hypothetical protein